MIIIKIISYKSHTLMISPQLVIIITHVGISGFEGRIYENDQVDVWCFPEKKPDEHRSRKDCCGWNWASDKKVQTKVVWAHEMIGRCRLGK